MKITKDLIDYSSLHTNNNIQNRSIKMQFFYYNKNILSQANKLFTIHLN